MKVLGCFCLLLLHILLIDGLSMERKPHPCPFIPRTDGHRPGHLEQLGCQRPPIGPVKEYFEAPTPRELYENHVKPYIPAVIRNALKGSPALSKWTEDKYLIDMYGDQDVAVEKKYEDRKSEPKRMVIKDFLENYQNQNWYVVSILPNAMRRDIRVPKPLVCSSFNKNLAELNLWIGTRGTRSMLHFDADNIMHCVVSGFKDWILIDRAYKDKLDLVVVREGQGSGFSHIDVDSISEDVHPEVWDVPWQYVTLHGGDCLYLPHKYVHQVRSFNRTISSTFLWYPEPEFNDEDCKGVNYDDYLNLTDTYVHWTYDKGQETVDMGYANPLSMKRDILSLIDALGLDRVDLDTHAFIAVVQLGESVEPGLPVILKLFAKLDKDRDGYFTRDEFENIDMEYLKEYCRAGENPHAPTESMLKQSDKYSAKSSEFDRRDHPERFIDSFYAKTFMQFVMRIKGKDRLLTFPIFEEAVQVRDGHIAEAFILFDQDLNGVITTKELNDTSSKRYRDFSRMRYNLVGTKISGGGKHEPEVMGSRLSFLKKLNEIPKKLLSQEEPETQNDENDSVITPFLMELRDYVGSGINAETFLKSSIMESSLIDSFGYNLVFRMLDLNKDGLLTASDIDEVLKSEENEEQDEIFSPVTILGSLGQHLETMRTFRPDIEKFKTETYGDDIDELSRPPRSEL